MCCCVAEENGCCTETWMGLKVSLVMTQRDLWKDFPLASLWLLGFPPVPHTADAGGHTPGVT